MNTKETAYTKMLAQIEDLLDIHFIGATLGEKAINYYSHCHRIINDDFKAGRDNIHIDFLMSGLNNLPDHCGIVWRGIKAQNINQLRMRYVVGEIVKEQGFISSSESIEVAREFAWLSMKNNIFTPVIFKIISKTGKNISYLGCNSGSQKEVLFRPLSSFLVLDFVEFDDHVLIELEEQV